MPRQETNIWSFLREAGGPNKITLMSERLELADRIRRDQAILNDPRAPQSVKDRIQMGHRSELIEIDRLERKLSSGESKICRPNF